MNDWLLIEDLASVAPATWRERIERFEVLRPLAAKIRITAKELTDAMATMSVGRRQFYSLLKRHRMRLAGAPATRPGTGLSYHLDEATEGVISQAIAEAGPATRQVDIIRLAARISAERGLAAPSDTSIRTRLKRSHDRDHFRQKLSVTSDYVADVCALDLLVDGGEDRVGSAHLLAIIDSSNGELSHYHLFAGVPSRPEVRETVLEFFDRRTGPTPQHSTLGLSSAFSDEDARNLRVGWWSVVPASAHKRVAAGIALRASVGHWLGPIQLRPRAGCCSSAKKIDPVPLVLAATVVDFLIQKAQGHSAPRRSRT